MLNRRIVWLLAAVIALGTVSAVPMARTGLDAEICAIACVAAEQCEQRESIPGKRPVASAATVTVSFPRQAPRVSRPLWPSSYQRPPTHASLL